MDMQFPPELFMVITIFCFVVAGIYIVYAVGRTATAGKNSTIKVEDNCISGKGYVGAIGKSPIDADHGVNVGNFYLTYDQITSVNASSGWIIIIAAGLQYSLKLPNSESVASEIQKNLRKAKINDTKVE